MNSLILPLLIGLSMTIVKTTAFYPNEDLDVIMKGNIPRISVPGGHSLTLSEDGQLGGNPYTLVWRGFHDNKEVAVKLTLFKSEYDGEVKMYKALNATDDPNIEKKGIPRVYCYGSFESWTADIVYFIAMTLFDETLEDRFRKQRGNISDLSLSRIFRRSVEVLEYIHSKNVIHNDIKPENIFLRGSEVFIGDFDVAAFNGVYTSRSTRKYGSLKYHNMEQRSAIDDLQSLIFSIWQMAGCNPFEPYGMLILKSIKNGKLNSVIQANCKHFIDGDVQKAFESICEEIFKNQVPNYNAIKEPMNAVIEKLSAGTKQRQFEWLLRASSSR